MYHGCLPGGKKIDGDKVSNIFSSRRFTNYQIFGKLHIKVEFFQTNCDIENVNHKILHCFQRRIRLYQSVCNYVGKLNKYYFYRNFTCPEFGKCHGCACKIYLKSQYQRIYVAPSARIKMHQVEFMDEAQANTFVCQFCVAKCMSDAGDVYSNFIGKSLLYTKKWNEVDTISKLWFNGH